MIDVTTINAEITATREHDPQISVYRKYYKGLVKLVLSTKQKKFLRNVLGNQFCDNICFQVVSEAVGRLQFQNWACEDSATNDFLEQLRLTSGLKTKLSRILTGMARDGNHVISVDWDDNSKSVKIFSEKWWDGSEGTWIAYDENEVPLYGVKEWWSNKSLGHKRRLVRDHESLARFVSEDGGTTWKTYKIAGDTDDPVQLWQGQGEGLGLPYIHVPNGYSMDGAYGCSDLSVQIPADQDQLNDYRFAMLMAGKMTGFQMYWGTGVSNKAADGTDIEVEANPGTILTTPTAQGRFGVLPAGDVSKIIEAYMLCLKRVAQKTHTPLHAISGGDWPSGEALLRAEQPAVSKALKQLDQLESALTNVAVLSIKIHNAYSGKTPVSSSPESAPIASKFGDPEKRDLGALATVVHNAGANISRKYALRLLKVPESEIERVYNEMIEDHKNFTVVTAPTPGPGQEEPNPDKGAAGGNNKL